MRDLTLYEEPIRKYSSSKNLELELFHGYEEEIDEESYSTEKGHGYNCCCNICREKEDYSRLYTELEYDLLDENLELANNITEELAHRLTCAGKKTTLSCFTLHHVKCHKTEDFFGDDECRLKIFVDGKHKKTLKKNISDGQLWKVGLEVSFAQKVVVQLWDYDSPPLDPHDLIGKLKLRKESMAESKDLTTTKQLKSGRAHYSIKYSVKHPRGRTPQPGVPYTPGVPQPGLLRGPDVKNCNDPIDSSTKNIKRINNIRKHWSKANYRLVRAKARMNILEGMSSSSRRKSWNGGKEKLWFGLYSRGGFNKVRDTLIKIHLKLTSHNLVLKCDLNDQVWGYVLKRTYPRSIFLGNVWFNKPKKKDRSDWIFEKTQTFIHEASHLIGIKRVFREKYSTSRAGKLARRNPVGARRNAENYGYYVMGFK